MRSLARGGLAVVLLLTLGPKSSRGEQTAPAAQLEFRVPRTTVKKDEPFTLEVILRNTGKQSFYVVGTVNVAIGNPYGDYTLWVREQGMDWKAVVKGAIDPAPQPPRPRLTVAEFVQRANMVLLERGNFIGYRSDYDWKGTTVEPPGKYEIKVTYDAALPELMKDLSFPFLTGQLTSNIVAVNILDQ